MAVTLTDIISKADVLANPSPLINDLEEVLGQRAMIGKLLFNVERIKLQLSRLIITL